MCVGETTREDRCAKCLGLLSQTERVAGVVDNTTITSTNETPLFLLLQPSRIRLHADRNRLPFPRVGPSRGQRVWTETPTQPCWRPTTAHQNPPESSGSMCCLAFFWFKHASFVRQSVPTTGTSKTTVLSQHTVRPLVRQRRETAAKTSTARMDGVCVPCHAMPCHAMPSGAQRSEVK